MSFKKADTSSPKFLKLWLFGPGGSYKTRTVASAALDERSSPALIVSFAGNPVSFTDYAKKPDVVEVSSINDLNLLYTWLANKMPADHNLVKQVGLTPGYKTIAIDTVTELQREVFQVVQGTGTSGIVDIPPAMEQSHFGRGLAVLTKFARMMYALPMHVILTAQEGDKTNPQTLLTTFNPLVWGQSVREVAGYAYAVGRMAAASSLPSDVNRVIRDSKLPTPQYCAISFRPSIQSPLLKDQYGTLGPVMVDPSITKMLDALQRDGATK
jgi:hypothetical protein